MSKPLIFSVRGDKKHLQLSAYLAKNGETKPTISWSGTLNKVKTIALFCNHTANGYSQYAKVAYKFFKITDNGNVVFNGIPVRRDSDNVVGMYDTVSKTFFTNAGSGNFTVGPVVQ